MSILVIDVGTSGVRSAVVQPDASITHEVHRSALPDSPVPGLVEFDALVYSGIALDCARETQGVKAPAARSASDSTLSR